MSIALSLALALAANGTSRDANASTPEPAILPEPIMIQEEEIEDLGKWKGAVNAGVLYADGNTDLVSLSAAGDAQLRREKDRISLGAYWNFQEQENTNTGQNEVSQRNSGGNAQYDRFLNERTYLFGQTSAENDFQADLDLRFTVGGGVGHQFVEKDDLKVSAEAGLAWFKEEFGSSPDDDYMAARGAYDVDWQINEEVQFLHSGVIFPSVEDSDDVYAKLDTRARVTLSESMFAQLQWIFDWDNTPAQGVGRKDNRYLLSVGWSF